MTQATTASTIEAALRSALPPANHDLLPDLATLLADVASGTLAPDQASSRLAAEPGFTRLLQALAGQTFEPDGVGLHFGGDKITVGNVCDSDVLAVGRGAIAIKLAVQTEEQG
jgi:hypothetical protein